MPWGAMNLPGTWPSSGSPKRASSLPSGLRMPDPVSHPGRGRALLSHPRELADIDVAIGADGHPVRKMNVVPNVEDGSVRVEDLDPVGLSVGHVNAVIGVHSYARQVPRT